MNIDLKGIALRILFRRWKALPVYETGYTILLPSPMDMPFLLRFALEGLQLQDTTHCRQILVIPDGWADDGGTALREVMAGFSDPRLEYYEPSWWDIFLIRRMPSPYWMMVMFGIEHARCEQALLHDADAFFHDSDAIERIYDASREGSMYTLGVQARWDPFFENLGYEIPGTWETMVDCRWARTRPPYTIKGRKESTPHGEYGFDVLLYAQYLDYASSRIGVMDSPPRFVHFSHTVRAYRDYMRMANPKIVDELFRLLLLSMLEKVAEDEAAKSRLPSPQDLARGLKDPAAPVTYDSEVAVRGYREFRDMIDELSRVPIFDNERASMIAAMLEPFDAHFREISQARGGDIDGPIKQLRSDGFAVRS